MELNLQRQPESNIIRNIIISESQCSIKVADNTLSNSVILTLDEIEMWPVSSFSELTKDHFQRLAEIPVELVLLGTGASINFPSPQLTAPLVEKQIGLELMDTPAACRTFNILAGDGRRVAAALILWGNE